MSGPSPSELLIILMSLRHYFPDLILHAFEEFVNFQGNGDFPAFDRLNLEFKS
jgi:hypothetical protein